MQIIKFGDIFNHKECEFIYLTAIDERIYAAKILDNSLTREIEMVSRIASGGGDRAAKVRNLNLLCYIILSTEEFKKRAACYAIPADSNLTFDLRSSLNIEDIKKLKEAITKDKEYLAPELIEEVAKITVV